MLFSEFSQKGHDLQSQTSSLGSFWSKSEESRRGSSMNAYMETNTIGLLMVTLRPMMPVLILACERTI